ncbi:MAG: DUF4296 domain-containing protein [Flavobacteriaceae bacterium]
MKKILLFFFVGFMFSCGEKVVEKPENLIPREKMIVVLHDLAILNTMKSSFRATLKENDIEIMEFLYRKYGIDSVQFVQSDLYYASVPLEYQTMYEKVEEMLEVKRKAIEEVGKKKSDSLSNIRKRKNDSISKSKGKKKNVPDV